jgi:hypothetical protein
MHCIGAVQKRDAVQTIETSKKRRESIPIRRIACRVHKTPREIIWNERKRTSRSKYGKEQSITIERGAIYKK